MSDGVKGSFISKAGKTFWISAIIMFILLILSCIMLSTSLYEYVKSDDEAFGLTSGIEKTFDVFSMSYDNEKGEVTVFSRNDDNVIAPGTETDYYIRFRNDDDMALDIEVTPEVIVPDDVFIPIKFMMTDPNGNFIIGNNYEWYYGEDVESNTDYHTFVSGDLAQYILRWKWDFEGTDGKQTDELDTYLGNLEEGPFVTVKVHVKAEVNTSIKDNGGIKESGIGNIILYGVFIILLIVGIIMLFLYSKSRFKKNYR